MTVGSYLHNNYIEKYRNKIHNNHQNDEPFKIVWSPFPHRTFYSLIIKSMDIAGENVIDFSKTRAYYMGAMIDSGTTYTHIARSTWPGFIESLNKFCEKEENCKTKNIDDLSQFCWEFENENDLNTFPIFTLTLLNNEKISWKPQSYMYQSDQEANVWCIAIKNNEDDTTVLGMSFFINKNIIFDHEKQAIGIIEMECPQCKRPEIANMFTHKKREKKLKREENTSIIMNNSNDKNEDFIVKTEPLKTLSIFQEKDSIYDDSIKINKLHIAQRNSSFFFEGNKFNEILLAFVSVIITFFTITLLYFGLKAICHKVKLIREYASTNGNNNEETAQLT